MTRHLATAVALSALLGCSPALDWREVRPQGSHATVMFPCKPASQVRRVTLGGASVEMSMFACSAGGVTYALTFADVGEPARVAPALAELASALQSHLQSSAPAASEPVSVPGMTPNAQAARWRLAGRLPDGRASQEHAALFAHATRVYQATLLGPTIDAEAQDTFFAGLRLAP